MTVSYDDIVGPYLDESEAAVALGITADDIAALVADDAVLRLRTVEGARWFPAFQFKGGTPLPFLAEVLTYFAGARLDAALWLVQPDRNLHGISPADALRGNDPAFALELARRAGHALRT